jgi:hypothetical protein
MPNCKLTEQLTLRLLKGQTSYKYQRPVSIIDEECFFNLVCRKTHDAKGNPVPLVDKEGKPNWTLAALSIFHINCIT